MKTSFNKKIFCLILNFLFSFILFAKQSVFYVAIPEVLFNKIENKSIYSSKKEKIELITTESFGYSVAEVKLNLETDSKIKKNLLYISFISDKKNDFLESHFFETKSSLNETCEDNFFTKEHSYLFNKTILYPCMPFSENMPVCGNIDEFLSWKNKIQFFKFDEIPAGYIAIPFSNEKKNQKMQSDLRAIDAIYSNMENYPFYEGNVIDFYCLPCSLYFSEKDSINIDSSSDEAFIKQWNQMVSLSDNWIENDFSKIIDISSDAPSIAFISSVGDIMIARNVDNTLIRNKSPDYIFNNTLKVLQNNDFTMGNLEGAVTKGQNQAIKTYTFKFNKNALPYLKDAGFDYFMLTNNHCYDYGEQGFKDTLEAMEEYDIKTSGAGYNQEEAEKFYNKVINDIEIGVLSIGAYPQEQNGFNGKKQASATQTRAGILWKSDELYEKVQAEKDKNHFVILNIHDGLEYTFKPYAEQRKFYEKLCDSGADVIFGSHPHVLQPVEWYKNSLIVWSQGNFIFPGMGEVYKGEDTMIVRIGIIKNRIIYYQKYPAKINNIKVDLK